MEKHPHGNPVRSFLYILSVLELVLYTPLTYYLEAKHNHDRLLARGIDMMLKAESNLADNPATELAQ